MTQLQLVHLARSLQLDSLETAWSQAVAAPNPGDAPDYGATVEALLERDMAGKALNLASAMVQALSKSSALDAAIELAHRVVRRGAHNDALAKQLVELWQKRFGDEEWFTPLASRAGLDPANVTVPALQEFDKLRRFTKGNVVYHTGGWGEGEVVAFHASRSEVSIQFLNGRREDFPLETVISRFRPIDPDDLRAMKMQRLDTLQKLADEAPAELIRKTARLYRGTANSQQIKQELCPKVVAEKNWNTFWKRAKTAAAKDPWLRVEGNTSRPVFVVRDKPVSLLDEARKSLQHCSDLGEKIATLRDYLKRGEDADMKGEILGLCEETVEQSVKDGKANHAHVLDGVMLLDEHGRKASVSPAQELAALLHGQDGALHPKAFDRLPTQDSRDHAVSFLPEAIGEHWADRCVTDLTEFPLSIVETLVQKLIDTGNGARLLDIWDRVAPYPRRHPMLTYLLARSYAEGVFEARADRPTPINVGRVLMHLCRVLCGERKGNQTFNRILGRVTSLMTGKRGFLGRIMAEVTREDLSDFLGIAERGGEDFPQEVMDQLLRVVAEKYPDLTAKQEKPYWERTEFTFTTITGLKRIKEEYRVLVEDKIPANSKAIGAAAALGDLSENSEWESAMEEQRNLTSRATDMDQQIRTAKLIEDQPVPEDIVAPGVRVEFTEEATGATRHYVVLGPWDVTDEQVINYRAPVAAGILGLRVGESGEIPSPTGPVRVRIDAIERAV